MASPLLYSKKALSIENQIDYLKSKNVIISNEQYAARILKRINYFRLKGYMLPFKKSDGSYSPIAFEDLAKLVRVDQLLRSLILKYTEHIEITLRTFIVRALTKSGNSIGMEYLDPAYFNNADEHTRFINKLLKDFNGSDELYAIHYKQKYDKYPIWVCIDTIPFGSLCRFYNNFKYDIKAEISSYYTNRITHRRLTSYLLALTYLRNKCAHFSRIYYKSFYKYPMGKKWHQQFSIHQQNNKLFTMFVIMKDICVDPQIWKSVVSELDGIIQNYSDVINLEHIGFPADWESRLK